MIARVNDELALPAVAARIPNAIQAAIRYYESERFWFNEGESTASTVDAQQAYAMPTDFLEAESLTVTKDSIRYPMKRRPWSWLRQRHFVLTARTLPRNWSYFANQIWLYPIPDAIYTLTISFLKRQAALSAYADTNDWMVHGEELIRTRAEWDLMFHTAKDYQAAAMLEQATEKALDNLRGKSEQKIATGRLSFDDGLLGGRETYNINYQ